MRSCREWMEIGRRSTAEPIQHSEVGKRGRASKGTSEVGDEPSGGVVNWREYIKEEEVVHCDKGCWEVKCDDWELITGCSHREVFVLREVLEEEWGESVEENEGVVRRKGYSLRWGIWGVKQMGAEGEGINPNAWLCWDWFSLLATGSQVLRQICRNAASSISSVIST